MKNFNLPIQKAVLFMFLVVNCLAFAKGDPIKKPKATLENPTAIFAPPTVTRTSTPIFYVDFGAATSVNSAYASYLIASPAGSALITDLWVEISTFAGGSVTLAPNESNLTNLGSLAAGNAATAYFYLRAATVTATAQSHVIKVYDGKPGAGGVLLNGAGGTSFSFTAVESVLEAAANKVNTSLVGPTPAALGGIITMTVTGNTGTVGAAKIFSATPAAFANWDPTAYELISSQFTFAYNAGTADDVIYNSQLQAVLASTSATDYTLVYQFRAATTTSTPTVVSPISSISSGGQIKHTTLNSVSTLPAITSAQNFLTLSKATSTPVLTSGGTGLYTITLTNTSAQALLVDDIVDIMPTGSTYVAGTSVYGGSAVANPTISGQTLTWGNTSSFSVPANGSVTLAFSCTIPNTKGLYTNSAYARIGPTQIDTTLSTTDDAKATASIAVDNPPVAVDDTYSVAEDSTGTVLNIKGNDTDIDVGDVLSILSINGVTLTPGTAQTIAVPNGTISVSTTNVITFAPAANFVGAITFDYVVTDAIANDTGTVNITVTAVNDPPVNTLPATFTKTEDVNLTLSGLSITDIDVGAGTVTVTLSVPSGTLTASTAGGVTVSGSGTGSLVLSGTLANINAFLIATAPVFVSVLDFNGTVVLTMLTNDGGNTGTPGALTDTDTSTITVTAVVDIVADSLTTNVNVAITANVITGTNGASADNFENSGRVISSVTQGTNGAVTFLADGTVTYTPNTNFSGTDSFTYTVTSGGVTETTTVSVTINPLTNLAINKTADSLTPNVGGSITFTLTASNAGPSTATSVVATDLLAAGYTFVSASTATGTYTSATGAWAIGTLSNGASATLTITATVNATGSYANTATITGAQTDPTPANNTVTITPVPVPQTDLVVTKTASNMTPNSGATITFTITAANLGPSPATAVSVSDLLPSGYTFVSSSTATGTYTPGTGVWAVGALASGAAAVSLTITATVNSSGVYANTATISGGQADPISANNSVTVTPVPITDTNLAITKTASSLSPGVGTTITFTLTASNLGSSPSTTVVVNDLLASGYTFVSAAASTGSYVSGTGVWTIGALANGASATLTITATVNLSGVYANTATISGELTDPVPANNTATVTPVPVPQTNLSVFKSVNNLTPYVGDTIVFTVVASNGGPSPATAVVVNDPLTVAYTFVSATTTAGTYNSGTGVWTIGSMANGETQTLTITAIVNAAGQ